MDGEYDSGPLLLRHPEAMWVFRFSKATTSLHCVFSHCIRSEPKTFFVISGSGGKAVDDEMSCVSLQLGQFIFGKTDCCMTGAIHCEHTCKGFAQVHRRCICRGNIADQPRTQCHPEEENAQGKGEVMPSI